MVSRDLFLLLLLLLDRLTACLPPAWHTHSTSQVTTAHCKKNRMEMVELVVAANHEKWSPENVEVIRKIKSKTSFLEGKTMMALALWQTLRYWSPSGSWRKMSRGQEAALRYFTWVVYLTTNVKLLWCVQAWSGIWDWALDTGSSDCLGETWRKEMMDRFSAVGRRFVLELLSGIWYHLLRA